MSRSSVWSPLRADWCTCRWLYNHFEYARVMNLTHMQFHCLFSVPQCSLDVVRYDGKTPFADEELGDGSHALTDIIPSNASKRDSSRFRPFTRAAAIDFVKRFCQYRGRSSTISEVSLTASHVTIEWLVGLCLVLLRFGDVIVSLMPSACGDLPAFNIICTRNQNSILEMLKTPSLDAVALAEDYFLKRFKFMEKDQNDDLFIVSKTTLQSLTAEATNAIYDCHSAWICNGALARSLLSR